MHTSGLTVLALFALFTAGVPPFGHRTNETSRNLLSRRPVLWSTRLFDPARGAYCWNPVIFYEGSRAIGFGILSTNGTLATLVVKISAARTPIQRNTRPTASTPGSVTEQHRQHKTITKVIPRFGDE
jgi:hypothetical protein